MKKDTTPISNSVWPIYSALSVEKALQEQGVASEGLSSEEIYLRQNKNGPNELGEQKVRWYHVLGRQFASPFIYILLATVPLSIIFGETIDAVMIILFIVINVALGFTQEYRSEKNVGDFKFVGGS